MKNCWKYKLFYIQNFIFYVSAASREKILKDYVFPSIKHRARIEQDNNLKLDEELDEIPAGVFVPNASSHQKEAVNMSGLVAEEPGNDEIIEVVETGKERGATTDKYLV